MFGKKKRPVENNNHRVDEEAKPGVEYYKEFIDTIVAIRDCVAVQWVKKGSGPKVSAYAATNEFIGQLSYEQKEILCKMLQEARDSGIHDVLAELEWQQECGGMKLQKNGIEIPLSPFESMHYDYVARCAGDTWPDER